ncbi:hypothetical protein HYU20_00035 [Candidatus Woesearchaeota archaeon]|nr:hypothetical protein [Candidatus Woesearchaeota archaeon]
MAEGLSFTAKGAIALIVIVILAGAYGKAPKIAQAAFETTDGYLEEVGVNIFSFPKILSLNPSLQPDGSLAVSWTLNKDAKEIMKGGEGDYLAEFYRKEYPDPGVLPVRVCATTRKGDPTYEPGFGCAIGDKKAALGATGCSLGKCGSAPPGEYTITVSFEKKDKGKTYKGGEDASFSFFTKAYLEKLDKDVKGCPDCNVKECKRKVVRDSLFPRNCIYGVKVVYNRAFNELYPPISGPVLTSPEFASCQYPPSMLPITNNDATGFKAEDAFKLCPSEEINKLHQKAASWVFFDYACKEAGMADETVKEVENLFKTDKNGLTGLSVASSETQIKLSGCVRNAEQAFTGLGWSFFLTEEDRKGYNVPEGLMTAPHDMAQTDAMKAIDKYLQSELPPLIRNLKAAVEPAGKISLKWDLPVGSNNVKNIGLAYMYRSFVSSSDVFTSLPVVVPLNKASRSYTLTPKEFTGQHRFIVTAESANPVADSKNFPKLDGTVQLDTEQADIGIYNNNYIELYRDLKNVDDACGEGCNVVGRKEDALSNDKLIIGKTQNSLLFQAEADAINEGKLNDKTCKLYINEKGRERFRNQRERTACTEKEVDALFTKVVEKYANVKGLPVADGAQKVVSDLLKPECADEQELLDDSRYKDTGIKQVCEAKKKLRAELENAKWVYLSG